MAQDITMTKGDATIKIAPDFFRVLSKTRLASAR